MKNNKWLNGSTVVIAICVLIFIGWKLFGHRFNANAKTQIVKNHKRQSDMLTSKIDSLVHTINSLSNRIEEQTIRSNKIIMLHNKENEVLMKELLTSKDVSEEVQNKISLIKEELNEITTPVNTDTFPIFR